MPAPATYPSYREIIIDDALRLIEPDVDHHAAASLSWVRSPEVVQFMGADFPDPSLETEIKRIEDILKNNDEVNWMIEYRGEVIGNVSINGIAETTEKFGVRAGNLTILIGVKAHWGNGIGTRVSQAILKWAFVEAGFQAMAARALQENLGSIATLQTWLSRNWH